ncbi:MAG: hypothetical protein COA97_09025 [Flavobacteriales bacterium]|nr:MAG: hypothetical protein COA97_09025 [Flavobacteriales bacterium]
MNNIYRKVSQIASIFLIVILITPIVLSSIMDGELFEYSIYEKSQNEEKSNESDSEEEEEKELEDYVFLYNLNKKNLLSLNNKSPSFYFIFFGNIKSEILTPPPDYLTL